MLSKITFAAALLIACTNADPLKQYEAIDGPKITSKASTVPETDKAVAPPIPHRAVASPIPHKAVALPIPHNDVTHPFSDAAHESEPMTLARAVNVANKSVANQVANDIAFDANETPLDPVEVANETPLDPVEVANKLVADQVANDAASDTKKTLFASDSLKPESATVLMTQFGLVATVLMSITMF